MDAGGARLPAQIRARPLSRGRRPTPGSPASPPRAAASAHTPPPGTRRHGRGRAPHARSPRRSRRPETPPPAARPPSARAEEGNAAGAVETLFLTEMFPRLPRRRPHSKSCRLTTDIQKTTETGPGRASRPPAGPGRPPSTAPGPHPPSAPIPLAGSNPGSHSAQPGQKAMRKGGTADPRTRRG